MARPTKIGLDYFPLDCNIDDNLELIEAECGLQGFAIVVKVWQKIYSNGYYIAWDDDAALLFARKINTELTVINSVINACFRRNLFDEKLYKKYKILTSSGIQKRYLTACQNSKRKSISFIHEFKLVNSEFTGIITELTSINSEFSTQSKVKESKVNINEFIYSKFYDSQLENATNQKYIQFIKYLFGDNMLKKPLTGVLSIKEQITESEFETILSKCTANKKKLGDIVTKIENDVKYYKGKKSLYRTLLNWAEDRFVK